MTPPDNTPQLSALSRLTLPNDVVLSRGSLPDAVASALREAILNGTLTPGTWLREAEVAKALNVSRTPVRDAFRILATDSLIDINTNQGAVVARMTSDDIIELYTVRESLEMLAARLAARRAPRRCLESFSVMLPEMKRLRDEGDSKGLSKLNFDFHEIVRDGAGNPYLDKALTILHTAARRFPDPTLGLQGRMDESVEEHMALADAISNGEADLAEELAGKHMRHLAELRIRMLLNE
jgi:DNA-binding GntR family transcriptional regulator